jgi:hypothetical protein
MKKYFHLYRGIDVECDIGPQPQGKQIIEAGCKMEVASVADVVENYRIAWTLRMSQSSIAVDCTCMK